MLDRNLYSGLIRLHILHHAAEGPVFGQAMIDELGHHGYRLSAGTLYPILHGMERQGYLRSQQTLKAGRQRLSRSCRGGTFCRKAGLGKLRADHRNPTATPFSVCGTRLEWGGPTLAEA